MVDTERTDYRPGVSLPHEGRGEAESETLLYLHLIILVNFVGFREFV